VVALLLFVVAVGKEHGCTAATIVVAAGTAVAGIMGDCPNTAVEGDTTDLRVGYTPYGTLDEHY
jgi:hypothetical protein